jgi:hypothetical protein
MGEGTDADGAGARPPETEPLLQTPTDGVEVAAIAGDAHALTLGRRGIRPRA